MSSPENTSSAADKSHALAQQHRNGPATLPGGSDSLPQELKGTCSGFQRTHPEEIPQQETLLPAICYELSERDLPTLTQCLETAAPAWTTIGDSLGFLPGEIKIISNSPPLIPDGPRSYFRELLSRWLKWAPPNHSLPTIETLASALRKAGEERLAFDLPNVKQRKELSTVDHSSDTQPEKSSAVPVRLSSKDQKQKPQALSPPPKPLGPSPSFSTQQLDSDAESENQRVGTIMQKIREFEKRFNSLNAAARTAVEDAGVSVKDFVMTITSLPASVMDEHRVFVRENTNISNVENITAVFVWLNTYWDYLNYTLLQHIVNQYGEQEIQQTMEDYVNDLKQFRQSTPLRLFCKAQPRRHLEVPPDFRKLVTKHRKSWLDCNLEDVEQFRQEFVWKYDLRQVTLILREMGLGSIVITWWIPASVAPHLKERIQTSIGSKFLTEQGILEISISAQPESSEPKWFVLPNEQEDPEQTIDQKLTPTMEMEGELVEQGTSLYLEGERLSDKAGRFSAPMQIPQQGQRAETCLQELEAIIPPAIQSTHCHTQVLSVGGVLTTHAVMAASGEIEIYAPGIFTSPTSAYGAPSSLTSATDSFAQSSSRSESFSDPPNVSDLGIFCHPVQEAQHHPLLEALITGRQTATSDADEYFDQEPTPNIVEVRKAVKELELKYANIVLNTHNKLEKIPANGIRMFLNELSVSVKENAPGFSPETQRLLMEDSLDKIFIHLRQIGAWDFLNFYILDKLIERFGDDELKAQIRSYGKEVESFKQTTKLVDFLRVWSGRTPVESLPDCKPLIVRHRRDWKTYTLADIDKLEGSIAGEFLLNRWIFNLSNASPGSVFLMWLIPESAAELIKRIAKKKQIDYKKMGIQLMLVGDTCLFKDYSVPALPWMDESYEKVYRESVEDREKFWGGLAREYLQWQRPFKRVTNSNFHSGELQWFLGGKLNVSENCLDRHDPGKVAIIWERNDPGHEVRVTYGELCEMTCRLANVLKANGIEKRDIVTIYMPTCPIAVAAMLACARIGAVHCVVFSAYDHEILRKKIQETNSKVIITANERRVGGCSFPMKENVDKALEEGDTSVKLVLVAKMSDQAVKTTKGRDILLETAMKEQLPYCPPIPMNSEDPLFIMYTSGTSDHPKCIVHTQAGYLLYAAVSHKYVFNYQERDIFCCVAALGWITGHTYVVYGPLCNGATTVLFDSTATYPDNDRYWEMIDRLKITHFHTIPSVLKSLMKAGDHHVSKYNLESLKTIVSAGEPLNPATSEWFYKTVGRERCLLLDTWWQTEIGGAAIIRWSAPECRVPPYFPKKQSFPFFGVSPVLLDEQGSEITHSETEGHLCLRMPLPGMGRQVNNSPSEFQKLYLTKFKGLYYSFDLVCCDANGDYKFIGRSDDAVRIKGVWLDVPKIESAMDESDERILETLIVGCRKPPCGDASPFAFVGIRIESDEDDKLIQSVIANAKEAAARATDAGATAVPNKFFIVNWRLTTYSGKIVRSFLKWIAEKFCKGDFKEEELPVSSTSQGDTYHFMNFSHMEENLKMFARSPGFYYALAW